MSRSGRFVGAPEQPNGQECAHSSCVLSDWLPELYSEHNNSPNYIYLCLYPSAAGPGSRFICLWVAFIYGQPLYCMGMGSLHVALMCTVHIVSGPYDLSHLTGNDLRFR